MIYDKNKNWLVKGFKAAKTEKIVLGAT